MPFLVWASLGFVLTGCATTVNIAKRANLKKARHFWLNQTSILDVEEAYLDEKKIYLKYHVYLPDINRHKVFFAVAKREFKKRSGNDLARIFNAKLKFIPEDKFKNAASKLPRLEILNEKNWQSIRLAVAHQIAPEEPGLATVALDGNKEQIFYYGKNDELIIDDIRHKPEDIKIKDSLSQEQLADKIITVLKDYLNKQGKTTTQKILITTFQQQGSVNVFMYVDLNKRKALNLQVYSAKDMYRGNFISDSLKSANQLILSGHIFGFFKRPVSSMLRLFSWVEGTAYDLIRPKSLAFLEKSPLPPLNDGPGMDLNAWEKKLDKIAGSKSFAGSMNFLLGGDEFFPRFIESLLAAKKSIYIRTFIFDNDDYGVKIADILKEKSKQGVKVKVLLDGMGVVMGEEAVPESLPPGFVPPPSMVKYLRQDSKIEVRVQPDVWLKADHTKTLIIDKQVCFTGGMNIGREYRYDWRDLMMEVKGPIVNHINRDFDLAWAYAGNLGDFGYLTTVMSSWPPETEGQGYPIRPLYTRINDQQIFRAQLAAIRESKKYIYIYNPYFSDNAILYELINARRRGVDVRVILPYNGNHEIMNESNIITANIMFKNGIRVYFYPQMAHIKAAVYDGWLCTGSANFDKLSFRDNLEFNLATSDPPTVNRLLDTLFVPDFAKSIEMKAPVKAGLKEYIAEFLAEQL